MNDKEKIDIKKQFPIGCIVIPSQEGLDDLIFKRQDGHRKGIVYGYSKDKESVRIKWYGNSYFSTYHTSFIKKVSEK